MGGGGREGGGRVEEGKERGRNRGRRDNQIARTGTYKLRVNL
jgi:hypothetical protein